MAVIAEQIDLQTQHPEQILSLRQVERLSRDDYCCTLVVQSHGFGCIRPFYFGDSHLSDLLKALHRMDEGKVAAAALTAEYEEPYVKFESNDRGHVFVSGELIEYTPPRNQVLRFSFRTDQTVLPRLIADLQELRRAK